MNINMYVGMFYVCIHFIFLTYAWLAVIFVLDDLTRDLIFKRTYFLPVYPVPWDKSTNVVLQTLTWPKFKSILNKNFFKSTLTYISNPFPSLP